MTDGTDGGGGAPAKEEDAPQQSDRTKPSPSGPAQVHKARRKTSSSAKVEGLSAGVGALLELDRLRRSVDQLAQGLTAMLATQATQTELLSHLLVAATAPTDPDHAVARLLEQLVAQLDSQGGQLRAIGAGLGRLPADVGSAVAREMSTALAQVR